MYTRRSKRKCPFGFRNRPKVSLSILRTRQWRHDRMSFEPNLKKIVPFPRTTSVSFRRTILQISSFVAVQPWPHLSYLLQRGREGEGDGWPCNPHNFTVPFRDNPESESTGHRFKRFNIYRILRYRSRFFDRGFQGHPLVQRRSNSKNDHDRKQFFLSERSVSRPERDGDLDDPDLPSRGISRSIVSPSIVDDRSKMKTTTRTWTRRGGRSHRAILVRRVFVFVFSLSRRTIRRDLFFFFREQLGDLFGRLSTATRGSIDHRSRVLLACFDLVLFSSCFLPCR